MEKQRGDGSREVSSAKALQQYLSEDDITVVGFFNTASSQLYTVYMEFGEWVGYFDQGGREFSG